VFKSFTAFKPFKPSWTDPQSLDRFVREFRMPRGRKKGVIDERAEKV
jgi:hypothetical protein